MAIKNCTISGKIKVLTKTVTNLPTPLNMVTTQMINMAMGPVTCTLKTERDYSANGLGDMGVKFSLWSMGKKSP